jgi:spore coat protein U-like protein
VTSCRIRFCVLLGLLLGSPAMLHAASSCSLSSTGLSFGNFNLLDSAPRDSSSSLTVTCTGITGEIVSYSLAAALLPAYSDTRIMANGSYSLRYNFFVDAARTVVFGDGTHGSALIGGGMTLSGSQNQAAHTIYARIEGHQNVAPPGSYVDTVVLTISY